MILTCRWQYQLLGVCYKCLWNRWRMGWSSRTQHFVTLCRCSQCQRCCWYREECHKPSSSQEKSCWVDWWRSTKDFHWLLWSECRLSRRSTGRCWHLDHHRHYDQQIDVLCHQTQHFLLYRCFGLKLKLFWTWHFVNWDVEGRYELPIYFRPYILSLNYLNI